MAKASAATILIVDDEASNVELLADVLSAEYDIVFATSGSRGLDIATTVAVDLVLLDVMMPEMDGYEVIRQLKSCDRTAGIPVMFITGQADTEAEMRGLELGAVDYVTKPFTLATVRARVRNHIELKRARDQISHLAWTDGLTGVANRRRFDAVVEAEFRRLKRTESPLSLILLDIDRFKQFNDTYGHLAGDDCLRDVARVLAENLSRPADLAARYGGEEFVCVLPETDLDGSVFIARRIRAGISALDIPHIGSDGGRLTASFGITSTHCTDNVTARDLVSSADSSLYRAKAEGRDRIVAARLEPAPTQ